MYLQRLKLDLLPLNNQNFLRLRTAHIEAYRRHRLNALQ
jgi:hypothetical protein